MTKNKKRIFTIVFKLRDPSMEKLEKIIYVAEECRGDAEVKKKVRDVLPQFCKKILTEINADLKEEKNDRPLKVEKGKRFEDLCR